MGEWQHLIFMTKKRKLSLKLVHWLEVDGSKSGHLTKESQSKLSLLLVNNINLVSSLINHMKIQMVFYPFLSNNRSILRSGLGLMKLLIEKIISMEDLMLRPESLAMK